MPRYYVTVELEIEADTGDDAFTLIHDLMGDLIIDREIDDALITDVLGEDGEEE